MLDVRNGRYGTKRTEGTEATEGAGTGGHGEHTIPPWAKAGPRFHHSPFTHFQAGSCAADEDAPDVVVVVFPGDDAVAFVLAGAGDVVQGFAVAKENFEEGAGSEILQFEFGLHEGHGADIQGDVE